MADRRLTKHHLADVADRLTASDWQVLDTLAELRLASITQLARLHFATATLRAAQRCLSKLAALNLVVRLERRVGGVRAGSAGQVYALGTLGQHLLSAGTLRSPRKPWTPSLPFIQHRLAITELYVELVEAERRGTLTVTEFVAEPGCWRLFAAPHGGRLWLKPDAALVTTSGDYEDRWLIELDCATESTQVIERKARRYLAYLASGQEQHAHGVFPRVLFVVPTAERAQLLDHALGSLPPAGAALFRLAVAGAAVDAIQAGAA